MADKPDPATGRAAALATHLARPEPLIRVRLDRVEGSAPREEGTWMLVGPGSLFGTIGGGFAEFDAIDHSRRLLRKEDVSERKTILLGPDTGQCCGGRLTLGFEPVTPALARQLVEEEERSQQSERSVMLFGAGHVGKAIARALEPLPFRVTVVETRAEELEGLPSGVRPVLSAMPESLLEGLPSGSAVLILTHDHALDFLIAREALARDDLAYVGMIGSDTKRARFHSYWMREGGDSGRLQRLTIPIGGGSVKDKRPAVIAAMVAVELLSLEA